MGKLTEITDKLTPKLAEALTGPLQGQAMNFIFNRLKVNTIEDAEKKIATSPDAIKGLQKAEEDYVEMISPAGDTATARLRKNVPQAVITVLYTVGYFTLIIIFIYLVAHGTSIQDEWLKGILGTLIGVLTGQLPQMNSFWFGTNSTSAAKTETIAQLSQQNK